MWNLNGAALTAMLTPVQRVLEANSPTTKGPECKADSLPNPMEELRMIGAITPFPYVPS